MKSRLLLLFLVLIIYSTDSFCQSEKIDPQTEETYWNFIRVKILQPNTNAARFETDIKVQLKGNVTHKDSLYVQNLITDLKGLIRTVDIRLTESNGNLILNIDDPNNRSKQASSRFNCSKQGAIKLREYSFSIPDKLDQKARNKTLKYYLFRGLTQKKTQTQRRCYNLWKYFSRKRSHVDKKHACRYIYYQKTILARLL